MGVVGGAEGLIWVTVSTPMPLPATHHAPRITGTARCRSQGKPAAGKRAQQEGGPSSQVCHGRGPVCARACSGPGQRAAAGTRPTFSQGLSLPTCTKRSGSPASQAPPPILERFSGYCGPAFPSIRILLHSCESFSKQTVRGRERSRGGGGEAGKQTQPHVLPRLPPSAPFHAHRGLPGEL